MATGSPAAGAGTGLAVGFASGGTRQTLPVAALCSLRSRGGIHLYAVALRVPEAMSPAERFAAILSLGGAS
jgi:hypothetical protein